MYIAANRFHNGCWVRDVLGRRNVMRAWIFVFRREHNMKATLLFRLDAAADEQTARKLVRSTNLLPLTQRGEAAAL